MNKLKEYLIAFLSGALIVSLSVMVYLLKHIKPVYNDSTIIEKLDQKIGKLKQDGTNNTQTIIPTVNVPETSEKRVKKPFLGIRLKRKLKN
jgi:uncharacterized membrane protein